MDELLDRIVQKDMQRYTISRFDHPYSQKSDQLWKKIDKIIPHTRLMLFAKSLIILALQSHLLELQTLKAALNDKSLRINSDLIRSQWDFKHCPKLISEAFLPILRWKTEC